MTVDYKEFEVETAPSWMSRLMGKAWTFVPALFRDAWVDAARMAVKARFPPIAPLDALPLLLRDFALDPPHGETPATTRARLARAWETWQKAGTAAGIVAALNAAGYPNVTIGERSDRWWEFVVILRAPFPFDPALTGYAKWDSGWTYDLSGYRWAGVAPPGERERVLAIINKWKPTHARLAYVLVEVEGPYWGEFKWGDGTKWGGVSEYWST